MTGMYPSRIHNTRNGNESFPESPPLISKLIADSGYRCGMIGKFHLQSSGHRTEPRLDDGFSFWRFSHAPRDDWSEGHHYADCVRDGAMMTAEDLQPIRFLRELRELGQLTIDDVLDSRTRHCEVEDRDRPAGLGG